MRKPIEEYYLHDHGDGNGWQVCSRGPGKWGVVTSTTVDAKDDGLVHVQFEKYYTGGLSTVDREELILTPEEAQLLKIQLAEMSEVAWDNALKGRDERRQTSTA